MVDTKARSWSWPAGFWMTARQLSGQEFELLEVSGKEREMLHGEKALCVVHYKSEAGFELSFRQGGHRS